MIIIKTDEKNVYMAWNLADDHLHISHYKYQ